MSEKWTIYGLCTLGDSGLSVPLDHPMVTTIVLHSPGGGWQLNEDRLGYESRENANKDWVKQLKQARLLASAPDLLEALQGLLAKCEDLGLAADVTHDLLTQPVRRWLANCDAMAKARAAISRATDPGVSVEATNMPGPDGRGYHLVPAEWEGAFEGRQQPFPPSREGGE